MENQFLALQNWMEEILQAIKKDIKSDHLHTDPVFYKTYFGNRPQNRLTAEEIFEAYQQELIKGNEDLAEWVVNRWVFKHGDLYQHFADRLSEVNPDFSEIKTLTKEQSERVLEGAADEFGAIDTFLFAKLNGVVFPEAVMAKLSKAAEHEKVALAKEAKEHDEHLSLEKLIAAHQREVARLQDKIAGVQKKYNTDTESLKKQIKALQKKLHANG